MFEPPAPGGSSGTGPLEPLPPGLDDRFLAVLSSGTRYFPNSVIPLVSAVYATRPTGLMVPERLARPPQPIDSVKTYLRGLDVFGEEISALTTVHHLCRLPLRDALAFCADLLRIFDDPRASVHDLDDHLRPRFTAAGWRRVRTLIADGSRMLVAPQVLLTMMKYAALSSGDMLLPSASPGDPLVALLGSADDLGRREDADDRSGGDVVDAGMPGFLAQTVVAAHHFHRQLDVHHMVGKFFQCWREYPAQLAGQQRIVDLPGEFRSAVGVRLDDFIAVGAILYLATIAGHVTVPRHVLTDLALEDAGTAERILGLVARGPADLRAWARSDEALSEWQFEHLERFPVVDFGDDLLLVRPRWLLQRFFGWLPLYDVEEGLQTAGAPGKRTKKIKSCLEHVSERYTRETLAAQAERHGLRMFDENDLAATPDPSSGGRRVCDLTLDDGPRWALLEVTTMRLSRHSATSGSAIRLDEDLLKLLAKVDQLHQTIERLREREAVLTGVAPDPRPRRYYPVLVMTEGFPVNPVTLTMLRERARVAGLLAGPDVAPLEVVDVVELEILEGTEIAGLSLLDALEAKEKAALYRSNLRDFLLMEYEADASVPDRVHSLSRRAFDIGDAAIRGTPGTDAA